MAAGFHSPITPSPDKDRSRRYSGGPSPSTTGTTVHPANLDVLLLIGSVVVIAAIGAARLAHSVGLPGLLVFLGLGLLLGESGAGIRFDDAGLAESLGLSALVLILAGGGLTTRLGHARAGAPQALALATAGVATTTAIV